MNQIQGHWVSHDLGFWLCYDESDGRYVFEAQLNGVCVHGHGLHCGDGFEVEIGGAWVQTRIEHSSSSTHSHGWYIVSHPNQPLHALPVRKEGA